MKTPRIDRAYLDELRRLARADEAIAEALRKDDLAGKARAAFERAHRLTKPRAKDERHQAQG